MGFPSTGILHPVLSEGVVRFVDTDAFVSVYRNTLKRGALTLITDEQLEPLVPFEVHFEIDGVKTTHASTVQVVSSRDGVFLAQILPGNDAARSELGLLAEHLERQHQQATSRSPAATPSATASATAPQPPPAPASPPPSTAATRQGNGYQLSEAGLPEPPPPGPIRAAAAAARGAALTPAPPPPQIPAPVAQVPPSTPPPPAVAPVAPLPAAPVAPAPPVAPVAAAPAAPVAQPPVLVQDLLTLANLPSLLAARAELHATGGVMASCGSAPPAFGSLQLRWSLAGGLSSAPCQAEVVFAQGSQVAFVFADRAAVEGVLDGLERTVLAALAAAGAVGPIPGPFPGAGTPVPAAVSAAVVPPQAPSALQIAPRTLRNPSSPPALLLVDLVKPRDPRQDSHLSLAEAVLALGKLRASGTLSLTRGEQQLRLAFKAGAALLDGEERDALVEAAGWPEYTFGFGPQLPDRIASDKRPRDPRGIVADMARRMLKEYRVAELEVGLASIMSRYPVPAPQVSPVMYGLKLEPKEARFLDVVMDGTRPLSELPRVAGMLRPATFRCFYIFLMYHLVENLEDARLDPKADQGKLFRAECERLLHADSFDVLGVHWSEHPNLIRERYQKKRQRFTEGSPLAKLAPAQAKQVLERMEQAFQRLQSREGRAAARAELGSLDLHAAAHILSKHAELASMRGDLVTVKECLEMALELHPSREYQVMMQTLYVPK